MGLGMDMVMERPKGLGYARSKWHDRRDADVRF